MNILSIMLLLTGLFSSGNQEKDPPCKKVNLIQTEPQKKVIKEVINQWKKERYFISNYRREYKGVVNLTVGKDEKGRTTWGLIPQIADDYSIDPPDKYDEFEGTIILIYEEDKNRTPVRITESTVEERTKCLREVIGDRLYINPEPTPELHPKQMNEVIIDGKKRMIERTVHITGNGSGADYWIIWNKDGSYIKVLQG